MPKQYTEKERNQIKQQLIAVALELMTKKGIKATTVDELVNLVHIPKGTFYLFYKSKELLFYDAIMQSHNELHNSLKQNIITLQHNCNVESLTTFLYNCFLEGFKIGILPLMINGELDVLMRKLPDELVKEHQNEDDDFMLVFKILFPNMKDESIKNYSASFRALFFTVIYEREIGKNFNEALKILIKGIVMQMMEENTND